MPPCTQCFRDSKKNMDYEKRRKAIKATVDQCGLPLSQIHREIEPPDGKVYAYNYVADVLRGAPGKVSSDVLDSVEAVLNDHGMKPNVKA